MKSITILSYNLRFEPLTISLEDDEGALFIYNVLQGLDESLNENNIRLKKELSEDDLKSGEKEYDFGKIRNGEKIIVIPVEKQLEMLENFVVCESGGIFRDLLSYDKPRVCGYRYYFSIRDNESSEKRFISVYYDKKREQFGIEPRFTYGQSELTYYEPCLVIGGNGKEKKTEYEDTSRYGNAKWFYSIKNALKSVGVSENAAQRILKIYNKHKAI